ncbi:MAG TPA: GNAT family N-acetyltransferase [Gemmatimonadales bacterium]|nr:GNAT family N-acetyltransferase [Gemmatimonadales bacterium]
MPDDLLIRPATPNDVPTILALIRELAEYEKLPDQVEATEALLHDALFGDRPSAEALMAMYGPNGGEGEESKVAGYALFFHNFSTWVGRKGLYLEDIYVRPQFRGKGIGRALLSALAKIARERNCGRMEWSVLDWNESAIGFYRSLGAELMEGWTICRLGENDFRKL